MTCMAKHFLECFRFGAIQTRIHIFLSILIRQQQQLNHQEQQQEHPINCDKVESLRARRMTCMTKPILKMFRIHTFFSILIGQQQQLKLTTTQLIVTQNGL